MNKEDYLKELYFEDEIKSNPIKEYIIISQNGVLEDNSKLFCNSVIVCVLVDIDRIDAILEKIDVPGNEIKDLGMPYLASPNNHNIFVSNRTKEINDSKIEFVTIQRQSPLGDLKLEISQEFELYYNLEANKERNRITYDDNSRRVKDVVIIEDVKDEIEGKSLKIIKIRKQYLLDYISIKNKSLLIGYYSFKKFENVNPDISKKIKQYRIEGKITKKSKLWLFVGSDAFGSQALISRIDMYKTILPNKKYIFSYNSFSTIDDEKINIKLVTWDGEINPQTLKGLKREGKVHFMSPVFFYEEVLKKYEDDNNYSIGDDGSVAYSYQWGIFRGIERLANKYIKINIGDFAEGIIGHEWDYWSSYNVKPPPSLDEIKYLRIIPTIQQRINRLFKRVYELNAVFQSNKLLNSLEIPVSPLIKKSDHFDEDITYLKKTIANNSPIRELLNRCNVLSIRLVDDIDWNILVKMVSQYNPEATKDKDGNPLGSLKLLTNLTILNILTKEHINIDNNLQHAKINAYNTYKKTMTFKCGTYKPKNTDESSFLQSKVKIVEDVYNKSNIIFVIYNLRNKGGAHTPSISEIKINLEKIGFEEYENKTLDIYRKILDDLNYFYSSLIEKLI